MTHAEDAHVDLDPHVDRVRDLEAVRLRAAVAGDLETLETLLHPDLRYSHTSGATDTRSEYLGKLRDGRLAYTRLDGRIEQAWHRSGVVLLWGHAHIDVIARQREISFQAATLCVWVTVDDGWQLLSQHTTMLPAGGA